MGGASRLAQASIICAVSALCVAPSGCSSGGELPPQRPADPGPSQADANALRLPFLVDDYFVPSGCFGDANCLGNVIDINSRACPSPGRPAVQSVCRRYRYSPLPIGAPGYLGFVGILFQDMTETENQEIGRVPGRRVEPGGRRVVFWAAVAQGSAQVLFRAGGANNWEGKTDPALPYRDEFAVSTSFTVTTEFQQVELDLSEVNYGEVVSPFGWSIDSAGNFDSIDLYIDDLRWE